MLIHSYRWFDRVVRFLCIAVVLLVVVVAPDVSCQSAKNSPDDLAAGKNFIPTRIYTAQQDQEVIALFKGLRVTDVCDGMDKAGLNNLGLMSPAIHPSWTDTKTYSHRIIGVALTVRYVPTNKPASGRMDNDAFDRWVGQWYNQLSPEPFMPLIRPGTVLVFDDAERAEAGTIGSNNSMSWKLNGCVGVITDSGARDVDEIAAEGIPLYFRQVSRGIRPGRNEIESVNRPIECGGVLVEPGDIVIADGDGVIVVPREKAAEVAACAAAILKTDKSQRRDLYKKLNLPEDDSVK
jgi:regulator of RNase E activity RraA